jgi:cell shape-determining protein MreC
LVFLPLAILFIVLFVVNLVSKKNTNSTTNTNLLERNKEMVDKEIKEYIGGVVEMEKEREEIKDKREEVKKEIENATTEHINVVERINDAPDDELDRIAAELRAGTTKPRNRTKS